MEKIQDFRLERFDNPPYSSDLALATDFLKEIITFYATFRNRRGNQLFHLSDGEFLCRGVKEAGVTLLKTFIF